MLYKELTSVDVVELVDVVEDGPHDLLAVTVVRLPCHSEN